MCSMSNRQGNKLIAVALIVIIAFSIAACAELYQLNQNLTQLNQNITRSILPPIPPLMPLWAYAVKFICNIGRLPYPLQNWPTPSAAENISLVPGEYKTDINIHNPSHVNAVQITKKFVISIPEPTANNSIVPVVRAGYITTTLEPDGAIRIGCDEVMNVLYPTPPGIPPYPMNFTAKGWVILTSNITTGRPAPLNVWAEYTAESFNQNNLAISDPSQVSTGISIDVEQITPAASQ